MKKILSLVLTLCLLMGTMCLATVSAATAADWSVTTADGASTTGGAAQEATTSTDGGVLSISVPARDASNNNRLYVYATTSVQAAYNYDIEFTMNIKEQGHKNSAVVLHNKSYSVGNTFRFQLGGDTARISVNDTPVQNHPVTLGTSHTYRIKGGSKEAQLYIDGVLFASTTPVSSGETANALKVTVDNGGKTDAAAVELEIADFMSYNSSETTERDTANAAIVDAFNAASNWEEVKTLITETYAGKVYITDDELAEAEGVTQSGLYERLVGQTYNYPGDIAIAFRAAVEEQKIADENAGNVVLETLNNASDWEEVKSVIETYNDDVFIEDAALEEAAILTQSELYERLLGQTYDAPEDVATAFAAAVAEQKIADAWLLNNNVTTTGDYVTLKNGSIAVDIPSRSETNNAPNWNYATIKNSSSNAYNFDFSFKAEMSEDLEYIGLQFYRAGAYYNLQIAKAEVRHAGGAITYEDLGTGEHTYRFVGNTSTNTSAVNNRKINFYIDGKFIGLLSPNDNSATYQIEFNFVNRPDAGVSARIWDYEFDINSSKLTKFEFTNGYDLMLATYLITADANNASRAKVIWAAYDRDGRMTSHAISDVITTLIASNNVFNLEAPEDFEPDYKVKAMFWTGVGEECAPLITSIVKYAE